MIARPPRIAVVTTGIDAGRFAVFEIFARTTLAQVTLFRYTDWWISPSGTDVKIVESKKLGFKIPYDLVSDDAYIHFDPRIPYRILSHPWDAVVGYGYGSLTTLAAALVARRKKIPFVLWSDARLEYERQRRWFAKLYKRILHALSSRFIASGTGTRLYLESVGIHGDKVILAPYAIDNGEFQKQVEAWQPFASRTRSELGVAPDAVVIVCVSRMVEYKGIGDLIRAFARLPGGSLPPALVLVGDGPDKASFEGIAKELSLSGVHFAGGIPHEMVGKYYAIGDIFVLPSHRDVWAKVLNEAMLFGLPLVVTKDVGAHYDLVRNGENGFLVGTQDIDALANALATLCQDTRLRRSMGFRSRELIENWTIESAVAGLCQTLEAAGIGLSNEPEISAANVC